MTRKRYYNLVNEFAQLKDQHEIFDKYPKMFDALCIYNFKLPRRIRQKLFYELVKGNWEHIWETDEEKKMTIAELYEQLRWDVFYFSDRMSWDRLCRIHWNWQRIKDRIWNQEIDKELAKIKKEEM